MIPTDRRGSTLSRVVGRAAPHAREASYFLFVGVLYLFVATFAEGSEWTALSNAVDVIEAERNAGIFIEPEWEAFILPHEWLIDVSNTVYFWGHAPLLATFFIFLYLRRKQSEGARLAYQTFRTGFIVAEVTGILIYVLFPVMPPRLLPTGYGLIDTLALRSGINYVEGDQLVNTYAAFPSLHFAWAILVSVAILRIDRRLLPLGLLLTFASFASIVVTANHYVLDAAGGAVVAAFGLAIAAIFPDDRIRRIADRARTRWQAFRLRRDPNGLGT